MGWKEGTGLGSGGTGITVPIPTQQKNDTLGIGANDPAESESGDDIYSLYRKRMMRAYRFRPNPLNNPRHQYY
jgi:splicing factor 4